MTINLRAARASAQFSDLALKVREAREATIDSMGCLVTIEAAIRQERLPGEGYQRKGRITFGPYQCYVYWSGGGGGGSNIDRGNQGGDLAMQDRDTTWGASLKVDDGNNVWPNGAADAMSSYEMLHPVYGRLRIDRVQQMSIQGANIGWQIGLVRVS